MTTLSADVRADDPYLVVASTSGLALDEFYQVGTEYVQIRTAPRDAHRIYVARGVLGTTAAAHSAGAAFTSVVVATQTADPPSPPHSTTGGASVTISDTDPGAIGANNLWLRGGPSNNAVWTLYCRNETDDAWIRVTPGLNFREDQQPDGGAFPAVEMALGYGTDEDAAFGVQVNASTSTQEVYMYSDRSGLTLRSVGYFDLNGNDPVPDVGGGRTELFFGHSDPSTMDWTAVTTGFPTNADLSSLFFRLDGGVTGELWLKTGLGANDWERLAVGPDKYGDYSIAGVRLAPATGGLLIAQANGNLLASGGNGDTGNIGGDSILRGGLGDAGASIGYPGEVKATGSETIADGGVLITTRGTPGTSGQWLSSGGIFPSQWKSVAAHVDPSTGTVEDVINALIAAGLMASS